MDEGRSRRRYDDEEVNLLDYWRIVHKHLRLITERELRRAEEVLRQFQETNKFIALQEQARGRPKPPPCSRAGSWLRKFSWR
jgi:hypothetical protein